MLKRIVLGAIMALTVAATAVPTAYVAYNPAPTFDLVGDEVAFNVPEQAPAAADPNKASISIKAPTTIKVGQLATIDVSDSVADSFDWEVVPSTENFQVIDNGKRAHFTTSIDETADSYMLIVGGAKDGTVDVKTWRIVVTGRPTAATIGPDASIAAKVGQWCASVNSPTKREDLTKLAQSFSSVAEAAKSATMTPDAMVQATTQSNLKALGIDNLKNWSPFFTNLQNELKTMDTAGKLPDGLAHIAVWEQIAQGLAQYASTLGS
jgi:hypothetical protein